MSQRTRVSVPFTVLAVTAATVCAMALLTAGCGDRPLVSSGAASTTVTARPAPTASPSATTLPSSSGTGAQPVVSPGAGDQEALYISLAARVAPLEIYMPDFLPHGARLATQWLPVVASSSPQSYDGPSKTNPLVLGEGLDAEIQVVYSVGDGWLVIVENLHGDLGDVEGVSAGDVAGAPAFLFGVNGGELVQWSKNGCWYGVFGRGVQTSAILATALGMVAVSVGTP